MSMSTNVSVGFRVRQSGPADFGASRMEIDEAISKVLGSGTGIGNADLLFSDKRTLAAEGSENLDLAGVLQDAFGRTVTMAKVKAILIRAEDGNTNNVEVGGAASNAFVGPFADASDVLVLGPGAFVLLFAPPAGWTVTAGTGDLLKVENSGAGTPVTYSIAIVGASA